MRRSIKFISATVTVVFLIMFGSCKDVVITPQNVKPLYRTLAEFSSMNRNQRDSVMRVDGVAIDLMMKFLRHDTVTEQLLMEWSHSRVVKEFTPYVDSVFPKLEPLENTLGQILENSEAADLDLPGREYVAVVWPSLVPIMTSDTVMFIALNHFLGKDFKGYEGWSDHVRKMKTPEQLPYSIAEALIVSRYPYEMTETSTALSRMMYEGAVIYVKLQIVPSATLSQALGYTTEQLQWLDTHYNEMWESVIGKDLIYSTSKETASRLVDPSPSTSLISPDYPGRAGRYLGYRLVVNYMENNAKTPIKQLLLPKFYNNPSELVLAQ